MKIAIVGSGISSLTAAYLLAEQHQVTVLEADSRIGGHTATKRVVSGGKDYDVDTGFIVYNDWTYPNFIRLMERLNVPSRPTEMSFSVADTLTGLEYSGSNLNTLFAQRSNILRPSFLRMIADILRFNRRALIDWEAGNIDASTTLGQYLHQQGYSRAFIHQYLIPMGAAIWSAGDEAMLNFPVNFFIRFCHNHGLLSVNNRPQWRTLIGGSQAYLAPLTHSFRNNIRLNCLISSIERRQDDVCVTLSGGRQEFFDQVILGCHSDQALALLADASPAERDILASIPYQSNDVALHTDTRLLPKRRLAWASWNSRLLARDQQRPVLTYNMNILQGLDASDTFCVTLNNNQAIDPEKVLGLYRYEHPVFSAAGLTAQARWTEINGTNRTWFCGAYWANGFHEDGVNSGIRVATALGAKW